MIQIVGTTLAANHQTGHGSIGVGGYALLAAGPVALLWRRRHPVGVLWATFAATLAYWSLDTPRGPAHASLVVAFVTAVMMRHRWAAVTSLIVGFAGFAWLGPALGNQAAPNVGQLIALATWLAVLLVGAELLRARGDRLREEARSREVEAQGRASEERLRIARDVHDVVAHTISLINIQAGVGLHLLDDDADAARQALQAIRAESKDALVELRSILGVLRADGEALPREPAPGLDSLPSLVERAASAGLAVHLEVMGDPKPLPAGVDLAAYRIVQEAVTNVIRHAGADQARVEVDYLPDALEVAVLDEGVARSGRPLVAGNGLTGMRERAIALGGSVDAGPRAGRGFAVRAHLPLVKA